MADTARQNGQIIVLGPHRSGTSAVAGALELAGAYFGPDDVRMPAQFDNEKGFWERLDVVSINDRILAAAGGSWKYLHTLDHRTLCTTKIDTLDAEIAALVSSLDGHCPWMIKDPRLCLTFDRWRAHLNSPVVLFVCRDPVEIALSLHRRNAIPVFVGLAIWEVYTRSALKATSGLLRVKMLYNDLVTNPHGCLEDLLAQLEDLGVSRLHRPAASELEDLIDPALRHENRTEHLVESSLLPGQRELWDFLNGAFPRRDPEDAKFYTPSDAALRALSDYAELDCRIDALSGHIREMEREKQKMNARLQLALRTKDEELEHIVKNHEEEVASLRHQIARETEALRTQLLHEIETLDNWMGDVLDASNAVFTSLRWRLGNLLARPAELLLLRLRYPTARDHVERIGKDFLAWRESFFGDQVLPRRADDGETGAESYDSEVSIRTLMLRMLSNPRKTLGLLTYERVRNFFITCLVQPASVRKEIVAGYVNLYHTERKTDAFYPTFAAISGNAPLVLPGTETPTVSVIVPAFNQFESTFTCLHALCENSDRDDYEVILADDCSTDLTREIDTYCENLRVVRQERNLGFLRNCNAAARAARGEYLFFLNNDTAVQSGCIDALLELVQGDSGIGIAGPKLIYPDGRLQEAGGIIWSDASVWNYGRYQESEAPEFNYVREVDYISGAAMLVRKDLWDSIGGFDTRFAPAYYEDTDLALQARAKGYKVVYQPAARVVHVEGTSHGTDDKPLTKAYQEVNRKKLVDKWRSELESAYYPNGRDVFLARHRNQYKSTVLVIDHYVPEFDKDAGSRSTFQYLKMLRERGARVVFLPDNFLRLEPYTSALQKLGIEVLYGDWYALNWKEWWHENSSYFDVAYLHRPHIASLYIDEVAASGTVRTIYFGHDLHYLRLERESNVTNDDKLCSEVTRWRNLEHYVIRRSDVVYYPSPIEVRKVLEAFPEKYVKEIPLYVTEPIEGLVPGFQDRGDIFFVGGFRHPPNVDAIFWLINEVLPYIRRSLPEAKLIVAGSRMPDEIARMDRDGVIIKGFVSDDELAALYARVRVVVVPLRFGAGIKGKVLEAMRYNVPVVTTTIGAEGLPRTTEYLEIADSADEFGAKVCEVYTDGAKWRRLADAGTRVLREHFSEEAAFDAVGADFGLK